MTKPTLEKLNGRIDVCEVKVVNLKETVDDIKLQVTNHIPTSIKELDEKVDRLGTSLRKENKDLAVQLAGVIAIVTFITQYFIK
jgi:uncharacterized membrane protein